MARIQASEYAVFTEHVEIAPGRPRVVDFATDLRTVNNTHLGVSPNKENPTVISIQPCHITVGARPSFEAALKI